MVILVFPAEITNIEIPGPVSTLDGETTDFMFGPVRWYSEMTRPNFFVVGTFKGGTTTIYNYLRQHPDIFMCVPKEPRYFAFDPDNAELLNNLSKVDPLATQLQSNWLANAKNTVNLIILEPLWQEVRVILTAR